MVGSKGFYLCQRMLRLVRHNADGIKKLPIRQFVPYSYRTRDRINVRKLATAAAVSLSLVTVPGSIQAVSLGEIEMYSALNQPLDAEVSILDVQSAELRDLVVKGKPVGNFGDGADAAPPALASMRFNVIQRPDGTSAIRITSDAPVIEPFLNFTLSVDTADGERMVREYTVLLNPPVFGLAQTDFNDDLLPAGNSVDTDGSAVIQRKPDVNIPARGVAIDFSDELVPQAAGQLPADLSAADRVDVTMSEVTGEPQKPATSQPNYNVETAAVTASQTTDVSREVALGDIDGSDIDGSEIELLPEMFETAEKPYDEIDLNELAIARDDKWYSSSEEVDLIEPIARDDSWYKSAVDIELTPEMFGLDVPARSIETVSVVRAEPQQNNTPDAPQQNNLPAESPAPDTRTVLPENEIDLLALREEFDYSKDGVPVPLDELAASIGRRVIGNFDSEVNLYEKSRVPLERTEIPAVATLAESPAADFQLDTSDSDADGGEPVGERIDIEKELPAFEARKKELEQQANNPKRYRVKDNDTLWSIAEQNRAGNVSTQQMMVALLRANRDAFVDRDMNRLRNGAILRIPEQSSASSISQAEALNVVREQMSLWQKYRGTTPVTSVSRPVDTQTDPKATEAAEPAQEPEPQPEPEVEQPIQADPQDRLTIVGVDGSAQDAEDAGLADGSSQESSEESVAAQLAAEQAIAEKLEAEEKLARERELAAIEAGKQRLITLQEEQLAALQEQTGTAAETASEAVDEVVETAAETAEPAETETEVAAPSQTLVAITDADESVTDDPALAKALEQRLEALAADSDARENALVAEAQSRSERLAGEADAIEAQLVALQSEKVALEEIGALDKAALVAEAEQQKSRLLLGAKSEQERIAAELEVQRQAIRDDLERQQLELKANPGALLAQVESDNTVNESSTAAVDSDDADTDALGETASTSANSPAGNGSETDDVDTIRLVEADADESAVAVDSEQTTGIEANAEVSAAGETSGSEASGLGATLQNALGDRKTLLGAGAGLALLGLLGAWLFRRKPKVAADTGRRLEPDFDDQQVEPVADSDNQARVSAQQPAAGAAAGAAASAAVAVAGGKSAATKAPEAMDETLAHDDTVSEADVYLAYGLYGQAEDLLTAAIDRSPEDPDYQMKLVETHFVQRDREKFQVAAARFQDQFDDADARDRIDQMAAELEGPAAVEPADQTPSGVIDALATQNKSVEVETAPAVQSAPDAAGTRANLSALPDVESVETDTGTSDDLHGLEALLGEKPEPDDAQLAAIAADEVVPAESVLDQTIDPGAEFEMSELVATGDFGSIETDLPQVVDDAVGDTGVADATLDEVDLSALDDDGTLNLDGITGDTMTDLDLENMDLTQQGLDATLDNLTLDDADLDLVGSTDEVVSAVDGASADSGSDMGTMLDLAKAYLDMGDNDSAISALRDIADGGTPEQREEARSLLKNLG